VRIKDLGIRAVPASIRERLSPLLRGHAPPIPVQRRQIPYWQERGWTRKGHLYHGSYQTPYGAFSGQIDEHLGGQIDFWLYMPSNEIQSGSHWSCFQPRGNDWYVIHMAQMPKDVSSGIITIERLITEAYEQ
jgi:hypothetical protein